MRAGKFDKLIRIDQFSSPSLNGPGTPAETWTALATLRAQLLQSSTDEFLRGFGASDETVAIFRTRYLAGVTNACRIHHDGRYFNIVEVKEIGRRKGLDLRAVEVATS